MRSISPSSRIALLALAGALAVGAAGCGKSDKLYPVSGKVTLKGAPLTAGVVNFVPDAAKGNKTPHGPTGTIGSDGSFSLTSEGKTGAPLGWYKATIFTDVPGMGGMSPTVPSTPGAPTPLAPKSAVQIDPKYKDASNTPLSFEVVATPSAGQYDIKIP